MHFYLFIISGFRHNIVLTRVSYFANGNMRFYIVKPYRD